MNGDIDETDKQTDRRTDGEAETDRDTETDRQTDRQGQRQRQRRGCGGIREARTRQQSCSQRAKNWVNVMVFACSAGHEGW